MPGRSTLTATTCPVARRVARWTCASEAAATGGSKSAKTASSGWPSSVLDRGARLLHREGRQLVLQHRELGGELGADDVGAGREELAELDVGGAERGERAQDRRLARVARVAEPLERPAEDARGDAERRRRVEGLERQSASRRCARRWRRCGSGARGCAGPHDEPHQSFQPECSAAMPIERLR